MDRFAIVRDGVVENVIVMAPGADVAFEGALVVALQTDDAVSPGDGYGDGGFTRAKIALTWEEIRAKRESLLSRCDWTQLVDAALSVDERVAWQEYRQALRDIPQTFETPDDVIFPEGPNG